MSKHVEAWNKLTIKFSASSLLILMNKYIEMHGQQNIYIYIYMYILFCHTKHHLYFVCTGWRKVEEDCIKESKVGYRRWKIWML